MKKFLVIYNKPAGCDYSIGCGTAITILEAKNIDKAIEKIHAGESHLEEHIKYKEELRDYLSNSDTEFNYDSISIVEISNDPLKINNILQLLIDKDKEVLAKKEDKENELAEKELFEKLKKKFERN